MQDDQFSIRTDVDFEGLLADHPEAEVFQKRYAARERKMMVPVEDFQRDAVGLIRRALVEFDADGLSGGAGSDVRQIGKGFFRCEGFLEGIGYGKPGAVFGQERELLFPGRGDQADRFLEFCLAYAGRLAAAATDDEVDACHTAFGESGIIGRYMALEYARQISADLFADQ
ncbi:hypothetical protein D3C73_722180 [compost metagenome]